MKPKFIYTDEAAIPPALKEFYTESGGQWTLNVEGAVSADKLREFRENNITLTQERDALKKTWEGLDPEEVKRLVGIKADLESEKLFKKGDIDSLIANRTQAMKDAHDKALKEATEQINAARNELTALKIDGAVLAEATKLGLRPGATDDLIARARRTFSLDDKGNLVAKDANGKPLYGTTSDPLTAAEWAAQLASTATHLFLPNAGGGAPGGGGGGGGQDTTENPWADKTFNMTKQGEIYKKDKALAARLAAQAGKPLPAGVPLA